MDSPTRPGRRSAASASNDAADSLSQFVEDPADALIRDMWRRGAGQPRKAPPRRRRRPISWALIVLVLPWAPIALVFVVVLLGARTFAVRVAGVPQHVEQQAPDQTVIAHDGELTIETEPAGALVKVDRDVRGLTPLTIRLSEGAHDMAVGSGAEERDAAIVIAPGSHLVQRFEMGRAAEKVATSTEPATRASGRDRLEVPPRTRRAVTAASLGRAARPRPDDGSLSIDAPIRLLVFDEGRLVGTSTDGALTLAAGRHTLRLQSVDLGFTDSRVVDIKSGDHSFLNVTLPDGVLDINALPWATVWLDGQYIGQTPIAHLGARPGTHELVFRHPQLGEQRRTVVVVLNGPTRVGLNFER